MTDLSVLIPYASTLGISLLSLWVFWALYVFTMGVYKAHLAGKLKGLNLILAYPIVFFALLVDVFFNLVVSSVVFLELPREWLVTSRLQRYMAGPASWRRTIAVYICDSVLDIFDPQNNHC
jgi:hypothetical protein